MLGLARQRVCRLCLIWPASASLTCPTSNSLVLPDSINLSLPASSRFPIPCQSFQQKRFAGHNKWSNIKHIKAAKDSQNAKRNHLYVSRLQLMVRNSGNSNPDTNTALRKLISEATAAQVPKATIDNALKDYKKGADLIEVTVEVRGPGRVAVLVECLVKNRGQVDSLLGQILKKKGGTIDRGLLNMFERKAVIIAALVEGSTSDKCEEDAIEAGAEEVFIEEKEKVVTFHADPFDLNSVKTALERLGYAVEYSSVDYIPTVTVDPSPIERISVQQLIDSLEEVKIVTAVHCNLS